MRRTRRDFLGLVLSAPIGLAGVACLGASDRETNVTVNGGTPAPPETITAAATDAGGTPAAIDFTPTPPPSLLDTDDLHGFVMPIEGACFPSQDTLMPNSARDYRNGVSEGVDFYFGDSCVVIERGTPVVAAYAGVVVRADHNYQELLLAQITALEEQIAKDGTASAETLDRYRGRQVWIDHGNGIITRYCHLNSISAEVAPGLRVSQGQLLGGVGESGTPESVTSPGTQLHLHWEVRVEDSFLGAGMDPETVRSLYARLMEAAG
ncbi:MAG: M23 family metallopeptidase [Dehalococcoidia bacterium]